MINVHILHYDVLKVSVATEEPDGPEVLIIVDLVVGPNAGPEPESSDTNNKFNTETPKIAA